MLKNANFLNYIHRQKIFPYVLLSYNYFTYLYIILTYLFYYFLYHITELFFVRFFLDFIYFYLLFCSMNPTLWLIMVWILIWVLFGYLVAKLYFMGKLKKQRSNAVSRSRNVVLGYVHEKIAPLLPNFPYSYKDLVFLGKWVDYLVLDWLEGCSE